MTLERRADALAAFASARAHQLTVVPVSRAAFTTAARWADRHELGLRAADALHAAVCAEGGGTLRTLDERLRRACKALGINTIHPTSSRI